MFCGLIKTGQWKKIYESLDSKAISDVIYNSIEYHIDNLLYRVPEFPCKNCKELVRDCDFDGSNMCFKCYRGL